MNEAAKSIGLAGRNHLGRRSMCQPLSQFLPTLKEIPMTTSPSIRGALATAIFGALTCSLATVCTAAEANPPQITVKFADLNVSNPKGAAALYARIQRAARQVCPHLDARDLGSAGPMAACVTKAIADAVAKVGQPALFDAYNAHNAQPIRIVLAASR
jgi:UrcA family protein